MLVQWLWALAFVSAMSFVSSASLPRPRIKSRIRDKRLGHLRRGARTVSVSARDAPLHISRFPMNKHGYESTMVRRSPGGIYFVPDENIVDILNAKQGKIYKTQPEIQTIQLVLADGDDSDTAKSLEYAKRSPIESYDIETILSKIASYHDNVKDLVREKHQKVFKVAPKVYTNKKLDDSNLDDIEAILKKAFTKPERERKLKNKLLKTLDYKKVPAESRAVAEGIQTNALKEILGKVMTAGNAETKANALDDWDRNSLYITGDRKSKRQRANSPFNSEGMLYITKPKDNKGPNLSALLNKVASLQRSGPGRSQASLTEDFSPDEMKRIERISRAIENDDRTFEVDKTIEHLDQQVERDDLADLQRFKDTFKSVRSKDPESDKYIGKIADLLRTDRNDKDPVFEFDTLVAK